MNRILNRNLLNKCRCPVNPEIITKFQVDPDGTHATAILKSMFKFPEGSEVNLQCDIAQCPGKCSGVVCPGDVLTASAGGSEGIKGSPEDGTNLAATSVFVLDPADASRMNTAK